MDKIIPEIREKAEETSFSGVVSIYRGKKALYEDSFGYADIANRRKNNVKTRFAVASGTKFFTALGIGTLIDAGKLSLETPVREILHQDMTFIDSRATIAQLLTHTSGIYDYYDEEWDIDFESYFVDIPWYKLETPSDYLPLFENKKPKYQPGERFSYSNGGFIFLGIIIEHITGQRYRDYIEKHVFEPAGMVDSGYYALKRLTKAFLTSHVIVDDPIEYGYGVYISKYNGVDMWFIVGGDAGVGFDSRYIPETELQITIISNKTDGEEEGREVIYSKANILK